MLVYQQPRSSVALILCKSHLYYEFVENSKRIITAIISDTPPHVHFKFFGEIEKGTIYPLNSGKKNFKEQRS
jgi:hypothetical protein